MSEICKLRYESYSLYEGGSIELNSACPYCKTTLSSPIRKRDRRSIMPGFGGEGLEVQAVECGSCGWWEVAAAEHWTAQLAPSGHGGTDVVRLQSKLNEVVSLNDEPLAILRKALADRGDTLRHMNPYAFERFVGVVLRDFLYCDVHHVGRSGDGGIDLLLVEGDKTHAVQVKRRGAARKAESVSVVRDFLGAMVLRDYSSGYVVSTADHFSEQAETSARIAADKGYRIELIAADKFLSVLRYMHSSEWSPMAVAAARSRIIIGKPGYNRVVRLIDLLIEAAPKKYKRFDPGVWT